MSIETIMGGDSPFSSDSLMESLPFLFYTVDEAHRIAKTNKRFTDRFPSSEGRFCYSVLSGDAQSEPCEQCPIITNRSESSSFNRCIKTGGAETHFKVTSSPIQDENGQVIGVAEYLEDITPSVEEETRKNEYSKRLESKSAHTTLSLKRTEHELSLMANSFHEINMAKDSPDLVLEIVNSFIKFRALPVFFAPFDPATTTMLSLSMHPANYELEKAGGDGSIAIAGDNPFIEAAHNRRFIIYHGTLEVASFVRKAFPGMAESFFAAMMQVLAESSILVLPLETESGIEAVAGLALSPSHLMEHFDTLRYIAKYSAMSLSKQNSAVRLQQAQQMTIMSLVKLVEYRDVETGSHLERLMRYTEILSRDLSEQRRFRDYITETYIADIVNSCLLHDIGKVGIPDSILKKPGKLTPEEFEIMKKHTLYGGDSLSDAEKKVQGRSFLNLSKEIAYYHHERYDGRGYPFGLAGETIPLSARIVAVADVYDALRSERSYKQPMSHEEAAELILSESGTHFDRQIVDAFSRQEDKFREQSLLQ